MGIIREMNQGLYWKNKLFFAKDEKNIELTLINNTKTRNVAIVSDYRTMKKLRFADYHKAITCFLNYS
jgi:uncharacterized protein YhbP (UPF0306 family)